MKKTIAVLCAMKGEAQPLIDRMTSLEDESACGFEIYRGKIEENDILICISGVGMVNMASLVTYLSVKYSPECFLNYGIIGGYGDIHKGSLIIIKDSVNINSTMYDAAPQGSGTSLSRARLVTFSENIDNSPVIYKSCDKLIEVATSVAGEDVVHGRLGSGDVWNKEYDKIMQFYNEYGVCGEDMEGYAMYQAADKFGIPALSLKGVSNNEILGETYDYSVMEKLVDFAYSVIEVL
ncbi:MAG: 5'-methylthioadenosine/S-adenosylhomocysteine nucleosidase [Oscillospiraceae bacterium]|nr:5'-methylthioadenosine/S-adenosylhomocysteine nucleosidase [Oscillospiraceae bacterium]